MRAFVTGGTGFVGAALVRELLAHGVSVTALSRPNADMRNLDGQPVQIVFGDVRDEEGVAAAMAGCSWCFHVAAFYSSRPADADAMFVVNVQGTQNVLVAARRAGVERVVHCSTIGTIGRTLDGSLPTEDTEFNLWETASPYARSKYRGECAALEAAAGGQSVVVVNPCAPVGPRDVKPSSTGQRIVAVLSGQAPSYLAGGINHVAVQDVARGHILAAQNGQSGQRYILGNRNLMLEDFLRLVELASGVRATRPASGRGLLSRLRGRPAAATGNKPAALVCDCSKAVRELGLPQTPLEVAFAEAVAWFRANGYVSGR